MELEPYVGHRRGKTWTRVSRGLHRPASDTAGIHEDLLAWRLLLPGSASFTHLTAAQEYGWWLPPVPEDLPVFVGMSQHETRPQRPGLRVVRHPAPPPRRLHHELPLAEPTETLLACGRDLGLLDMTVLCDAAVHLEFCTLRDLDVAASKRRRGAPMLRRVLPYVDGRSESAWESMLRLLHVVVDVPVEPQAEVFDDDGLFLARGDLLITGTRTLHEYDGGEHLKRPRQRKDLGRARRLGHSAYTRRGYTSHEVLYQAVGILRDADASLGRSHRPERIRRWHALLVDSLFTPTGTARLRRRYARGA